MPPACVALAELAQRLFSPTSVSQGASPREKGSRQILPGVYVEALDPSIKEIRLLNIHPALDDDEDIIVCLLTKAQLPTRTADDDDDDDEDDSNGDLQFTALSYVWGDPANPINIIVNGTTVPVTQSLASALKHIRRSRVRAILDSFWVDALCINQADVTEKSHQVQLMGEIYSQATLVISWLGPELCPASGQNNGNRHYSRTAEYAFDLTARVAAASKKITEKEGFTSRWLQEFPDLWLTHRKTVITRDSSSATGTTSKVTTVMPKSFTAFRAFRDSKLFTRGWVFQESVLARTSIYMCGDAVITGDELLECTDALAELRDCKMPEYLPSTITMHDLAELRRYGQYDYFHNLKWIRTSRESRGTMTLYSLLLGNGSLQVTDARDKVYSLLGVMAHFSSSPEVQPHKIVVDYSKPPSKLFTEIVEVFLSQEENLEFLLLAGIGNGINSSKRDPGLPSWAPDWAAIPQAGDDYITTFGFSGYACPRHHRKALAAINTDTGVLKSFGFLLEVGKLSVKDQIECIDDALHLVLECLEEYKYQAYPTGIPRVQAMVRLFMDVCSAQWEHFVAATKTDTLSTIQGDIIGFEEEVHGFSDGTYRPSSVSPSEASSSMSEGSSCSADTISTNEHLDLEDDSDPRAHPGPIEICDMLLVMAHSILSTFTDPQSAQPSVSVPYPATKNALGWTPHNLSFATFFQQVFLGTDAPIQAASLWKTTSFPYDRWRQVSSTSSFANIKSRLRGNCEAGHHLIFTEHGYIGMSNTGDVDSERDIVVVLPGFPHLTILRRINSGTKATATTPSGQIHGDGIRDYEEEYDDEQQEWQFVGTCRILGFMKGEAWRGIDGWDDLDAIGRDFVIR